MTKQIVFFGTSTTTTSSYTLSEATGSAISLGLAKNQFDRCNVLINLGTLTGSQSSVVASFQEGFSSVGFVETARSPVMTATGKYWLNHEQGNGTLSAASQLNGFPALGSGIDKQVVFTNNSIATVGVDVYLVFFEE